MNKKEINCSVFVVPNSSRTIGVTNPKLGFMATKTARCFESWGIPYQEEPGVQVWIHNANKEGNGSNWTDHGIPEEECRLIDSERVNDIYFRAPDFLPTSLFEGKKEGDIVELTSKSGNTIRMKLEQLPYRYGRFGAFEEVVQIVMRKYKKQKAWEQECGMQFIPA